MYIVSKISPSLSVKLDILRALAAGMVVLCHVRMHLFLPYDSLEPSSHSAINFFLFFATRLGHQAVIIFFVLSGYLVGGNMVADFLNKKLLWKDYFLKRFTRMWVVLLPALLIGGVCDFLSMYLDNSLDFGDLTSTKVLIGNVFFLQTIAVPAYGSNAPLWSIAYEFWYYMLGPLIVIFLFNNSFLKFAGFLLVILLCSYFMPKVMLLFPLWLLGASLRFVKLFNPLNRPNTIWVGYLFFVGAVVLSNIRENQLFFEYMLGIATSVLILYWQYELKTHKILVANLAVFFSSFSFSLYAIHFFLMMLLLEILKNYFDVKIRLADAGILNWVIYLIIVATIYFLSWLFYICTEKHTNKIRKYLSAKN